MLEGGYMPSIAALTRFLRGRRGVSTSAQLAHLVCFQILRMEAKLSKLCSVFVSTLRYTFQCNLKTMRRAARLSRSDGSLDVKNHQGAFGVRYQMSSCEGVTSGSDPRTHTGAGGIPSVARAFLGFLVIFLHSSGKYAVESRIWIPLLAIGCHHIRSMSIRPRGFLRDCRRRGCGL